LRHIDTIVIHCTAHPDAKSWLIGVSEIRKDHVAPPPSGRGWNDIGYHYVIRRNGEIECGRMESVQGAHCPPVNKTSIGVAWVGLTKPTSQQTASLLKLTRELMLRYGVHIDRVLGHNEADPDCKKACPVINMGLFRAEVL
jgi:N-acetylmuramoyl-L-alanine amidase